MSRDDRGEVGAVVLALSALLLVGLTLLTIQVWRVTTAGSVAADAARAGARAGAESAVGAPVDPLAVAVSAARAGGLPSATAEVAVTGDRCGSVTVVVRAEVSAISLPFVGPVAGVTVRRGATELIDPHAAGIDGEASCVR